MITEETYYRYINPKIKIKPCPFCGSESLHRKYDKNKKPICIACNICGAQGPTIGGIYKYWNWRKED